MTDKEEVLLRVENQDRDRVDDHTSNSRASDRKLAVLVELRNLLIVVGIDDGRKFHRGLDHVRGVFDSDHSIEERTDTLVATAKDDSDDFVATVFDLRNGELATNEVNGEDFTVFIRGDRRKVFPERSIEDNDVAIDRFGLRRSGFVGRGAFHVSGSRGGLFVAGADATDDKDKNRDQ